MARSLRMTFQRQKPDGLDGKLTASELQKLMSEVILLREKVARAELPEQNTRQATASEVLGEGAAKLIHQARIIRALCATTRRHDAR
jgi:hypothetical protein